jgi:hypothetical protein
MTEGDGRFTLQNSADAYPDAGFDPTEDHFVVLFAAQSVGTIYRIADEWVWAIDVSIMGMNSGRAESRREARRAFRSAWDDGISRLGPENVKHTLTLAAGKAQ